MPLRLPVSTLRTFLGWRVLAPGLIGVFSSGMGSGGGPITVLYFFRIVLTGLMAPPPLLDFLAELLRLTRLALGEMAVGRFARPCAASIVDDIFT